MSATNRGSTRRDRDAYYTPDDLADAIVRHVVAPHLHDFGRVVEPHVGGGAFARAILKTRTLQHITGFDLAPTAEARASCDIVHRGDWLADPDTETGRVRDNMRADVVLGNPPFRGWERHAEVAFDVAPVVVFLLRLSVLEGGARASWWAQYRPAEVWTLAERPSFTGGSTDSAAYGVMVWRRGHTGPTSLHLLSWRATRDRPALGVVW